ncbi:MAG: hypothetical protein AAFX87_29495, partial [Bacteroidota bacterium]
QMQWVVIIGMVVGVRILNGIADSNPDLAVIIRPIVYLYMAFAISTWVISPVYNVLLKFNPYGKYALSKKERTSANFIGISFAVGLLSFIAYFTGGYDIFLLSGIYGISMMIPLGSMLTPVKKNSQGILIGAAALLAVLGAMEILQVLSSGGLSALSNIYIFGVIGYQFGANALIMRDN